MTSKKDSHLTIRISPEELEEIRNFANSQGMSQSEFVLASIRAGMGKDGFQEKYIALASRLAILENAVFRQSA